MKKSYVSLSLFLTFLVVLSCTVDQKEKPKEPANDKKDRNMFGLHIPRGLILNSDSLTDGYIMFAVPNSSSTYLINRKGEVVHEWKGSYEIMQAYLQNDGSLIQGAQDPDFPVFGCCGTYGRLQKINWDSKILWDFEYANEDHILHHDYTILPNNNILAIAYEVKSFDDAIARGRKGELMPKSGPWLEKIVEIEPQGASGGKMVWEWHLWDHLIQDNDRTKANFGVLADHPELLNFNTGKPMPPAITQDSLVILKSTGIVHRNTTLDNIDSDIYHFNAIKYNPKLDQIVFSSPSLGEIFVIDHSTTTKEAATHKGGKSGKGGDFLFRWGNPGNYNRGDSTNQKLFGQHDVRWIVEGYPGEGNLTVFNNDIPGSKDSLNYSAVYELTPPMDEKGNYLLENGKAYGPEKPSWVYVAPDTLSFYASFISGAHRMKNGNTFINEGPRGRFFEVTPSGKMVWEYLNQYRGEIRQLNGDPVNLIPFVYWGFRSTFIPEDHPALAGKKLEPLNPQPKVFVLPPPPPSEKK